MVVGHDQAAVIPDEPGAAALRRFHDVERKQGSAPYRGVGHKHDRRADFAEHVDIVLLVARDSDWSVRGVRIRGAV